MFVSGPGGVDFGVAILLLLLLPADVDGIEAPLGGVAAGSDWSVAHVDPDRVGVAGRPDSHGHPGGFTDRRGPCQVVDCAVGLDLGARSHLAIHNQLHRHATAGPTSCPLQFPVWLLGEWSLGNAIEGGRLLLWQHGCCSTGDRDVTSSVDRQG